MKQPKLCETLKIIDLECSAVIHSEAAFRLNSVLQKSLLLERGGGVIKSL